MITREMEQHFYKRTEAHIKLVQKYGLHFLDNKFVPYTFASKLITHDSSKMLSPEYKPYVNITWNYYCQRNNIEVNFTELEKEAMHNATVHHVKTNKHHPEYWSKEYDCINKQDRDKPAKIIDASEMPFIYIAEMVCDWLAVSEERNTNPIQWANQNIGVRWFFSPEQVKFIYFLINEGLKAK